jgi:hypothetical protein
MYQPTVAPASSTEDQHPNEHPVLNVQFLDDQAEATTVPCDADLLRRKLARLRDLVDQALQEADPRLAALGIAEEAVLRTLIHIDCMIEQTQAGSTPDTKLCTDLRPLFIEVFRFAALTQRFARLRIAMSDLIQSLPESRSLVRLESRAHT